MIITALKIIKDQVKVYTTILKIEEHCKMYCVHIKPHNDLPSRQIWNLAMSLFYN